MRLRFEPVTLTSPALPKVSTRETAGSTHCCPPTRTTPDMYPPLPGASPKLCGCVYRHEEANHICAPSPDRFSCTPRTSTRPGSQIESGRRRLVFSFSFSQPALGFNGRHDFAREFLGCLGRNQFRRCIYTVDR